MYGSLRRDVFSTVVRDADHPEKYVRESFTWRRMTGAQVWILSAISAALMVGALVSDLM
ncbi:MAG: hypothetical protein ACM35H_05050 [Bacteroidota bacterium]